ncbi:MAG: dihydroorotase [Myxococcota bacterium]
MRLTITRPDDWHVHLRDQAALALTVPDSARTMGRAIVMPNLKPPVTTVQQAMAYRERILAHRPEGSAFAPLMTLYLTDKTSPDEIHRAADAGVVPAVKLYPAGATTNSDSGVTDIMGLKPVFEAMAERGVLLLVHGEVTDADIDIFDREAVFLERTLGPLIEAVPGLRVVLEHITTSDAVDFVEAGPETLGATITAHHLLFNRNHMLAGGIRPHYYCLPILKRGKHQAALVRAATSGHPRFFLGTDSAPHSTQAKEASCGCAGSYTAHAALEFYALAFEASGALDRLEGFASHFGPDFYGVPRNTETVTLIKEPWVTPEVLDFGGQELTPLMAGATLGWRVAS